MGLIALRPLTAADYRELPEGGPRYQLIEGDLHMAPAPDTEHQRISLVHRHPRPGMVEKLSRIFRRRPAARRSR